MEFSDITILSSINPITLKEKPSNDTIRVLKAMLQSEDFAFLMERMCGSELEACVEVKKHIGSNIDTIPLFSSEIFSIFTNAYPATLVKTLGMSPDWVIQITLLMYCHAYIDLDDFGQLASDPVDFVFGKKYIAARLHEYEGQELGAILVPFNITRHRLKKWVDKKWGYIENKFNETLPDYLPINKGYKNFDLGLTIVRLKDKEKLTFSQIADKLSDQSENKQLTDENFVKAIYYQETFILDQLLKVLKRPSPIK